MGCDLHDRHGCLCSKGHATTVNEKRTPKLMNHWVSAPFSWNIHPTGRRPPSHVLFTSNHLPVATQWSKTTNSATCAIKVLGVNAPPRCVLDTISVMGMVVAVFRGSNKRVGSEVFVARHHLWF